MIIKDQSSAVWQYYEASTDDGASSSRMSHLHPEPDLHRPPSPPPIQTTSPPPTPQRRLGLTALASTVFVVIMSGGMATFFLLFVILSQEDNVQDSSAFILRERVAWEDGQIESSTLSALSVSTAISHFLSITTPLVFSLLAYRTAHLWLRAQSSASADEEGTANRLPTPLHYGLLVRILNSSTILGLGSPAAYFIPRRGRANRESTVPTPRLLREAFAAAFIIYLLSHAVGLADIWLHAVSTVSLANTTVDVSDKPNFALVFNSTLCGPTINYPCLTSDKGWGTQPVQRIGSLVAANATNSMKVNVISLADANDTAILVPTDFVVDWNFTATTYGAQATCSQYTRYCYNGGSCTSDGNPDFVGPAYEAGIDINELIQSMYPKADKGGHPDRNFLIGMSRIMTRLGGITVGSDIGMPPPQLEITAPNPGPVLMQLKWTDFEPNLGGYRQDYPSIIEKTSASSLDGHDSTDDDDVRTVTSVLSQCELEFVRVRYGYSSEKQFFAHHIETLGGDPDSATLAGILWGPLMWEQFIDQLVSNIHQACATEMTNEMVLANIEQELTRLAIGSVAGVFSRTTELVEDASVIKQELVGRYPRTPVFVFAGLLYAYAAITIILFLSTVAVTSDVVEVESPGKERMEDEPARRPHTAMELAHRSLMDPVALIAEQHVWAPHVSPSTASGMSVRTRTTDMFGLGRESEGKDGGSGPDRLMVGLGGPYADTGNPRFGVWRRPKRQMEPDYGHVSPSIGSETRGVGVMDGTTMVASSQHLSEMMPPAYASLSRRDRPRRGRSGSDFSRGTSEYRMAELAHEPVRVDFGRMQRVPEKDLSGLMNMRSSVSSEGSEASGSSSRTVRRSTGV